jgi:hypothetical protein
MFVKKFGKMFIGLFFILVAFIADYLVWNLMSPGFPINPDTTGFFANLFIGLHFIPAMFCYTFWYISMAKRTPTKRILYGNNLLLVISLTAILTFLIMFIPALIFMFFLVETSIYIILYTILVTAAATVALLFCKPY